MGIHQKYNNGSVIKFDGKRCIVLRVPENQIGITFKRMQEPTEEEYETVHCKIERGVVTTSILISRNAALALYEALRTQLNLME